ncbi:AMIN domain-containing protein [Paenibacillus antri]|uniref:AMIN domain-containing protein n=1 Tax=Paenibacillus antri TaxID=2582848 RepID=A0A5R9GIE3_9BACL|nr:N-acetylmuramoyl-L-alanine amidase family protein [Paenibacillus antri]TLS53158.1 AMIN domain-containing protein [Paenibacillus antri]
MKNGWRTLAWTAGGVLAAAIWLQAAPGSALAAATTATLYVDGEERDWSARSIDGAAYLSLEAIAGLGGAAKAEQDGKTYTITAGRKEVRFTLGEKQRFVDGAPATGDATARSEEGTVYVPAAWLTDTLGVKVVKDRFTDSVYVFRLQAGAKPIATIPTPPKENEAVVSTPPTSADPGKPSTGSSGSPVTVSEAQPVFQGLTLDGDALHIEATGEVKPTVFVLKSPERIVVDLPNATLERGPDGSASGTLAIDANHPYIAGIRYSLFATEPSTVRIVVDLKAPKPYSLRTAADGSGAVLHFTEAKPVKVMIDAGHGGNDPGAISRTGKYEKDLTLSVTQKVLDRLKNEKLVEPFSIREDDTYLSPAERAKVANAAGVDLFISIHANTASSATVKGTETYYWNDNSVEFAKQIHDSILQAVGSADRKVKQERFVVVRETTMPAALLELGFITNADDEAKLYNDAVQDRIADAIVASIKAYFRIQ